MLAGAAHDPDDRVCDSWFELSVRLRQLGAAVLVAQRRRAHQHPQVDRHLRGRVELRRPESGPGRTHKRTQRQETASTRVTRTWARMDANT